MSARTSLSDQRTDYCSDGDGTGFSTRACLCDRLHFRTSESRRSHPEQIALAAAIRKSPELRFHLTIPAFCVGIIRKRDSSVPRRGRRAHSPGTDQRLFLCAGHRAESLPPRGMQAGPSTGGPSRRI